MSPAFKYSYGRLGLFVVAFLLLLPLPLNILVRAMIALVVSAVSSYFVLARWRNQMGEQLSTVASRRSAEKERLRAALAGDEEAAAAGDRVAVADRVDVLDDAVKPSADDLPASSTKEAPAPPAEPDDAAAEPADALTGPDDALAEPAATPIAERAVAEERK